MDQNVNARVAVIEDRDFSHWITTFLLMHENYSRAWVETFGDASKISRSDGLRLDAERGCLAVDGSGTVPVYQSIVYFETRPVKEAMLIADTIGAFTFFVSNDGGRTWHRTKPGQSVRFGHSDRRLVVRAQGSPKEAFAELQNIALVW